MNLIPHQEPFPYLEIEDFYTEKELKLVWKELDFLGANSASKLSTPEIVLVCLGPTFINA